MNYTQNLTETDVEAIIEKAFKVWSKVSPLTFNRTLDKEADIQISFAQRGGLKELRLNVDFSG